MQIGSRHKEDLELMLDGLRTAVELESRCDFADSPNGSSRDGKMFLAHFGALGTLLDQWDDRVERVRVAPDALWGWFARELREHGIAEPPFALGPLVDRLAFWTMDRSRRQQLSAPCQLDLQGFDDAIGGVRRLRLYLGGEKIATLPGGPAADLQRRIDAAGGLIRTLFDDAQTCDEAREIDDAHDALLELKEQLLESLELQAAITLIVRADDCPFCREPLELH
jgi:hypothetical protein